MSNEPHFEVFPEKRSAGVDGEGYAVPPSLTGQFVWHFKNARGAITTIGAEPFPQREDAHRSIEDSAYDVIRLFVKASHGIDLVLPIVDLDENGDVIGEAA